MKDIVSTVSCEDIVDPEAFERFVGCRPLEQDGHDVFSGKHRPVGKFEPLDVAPCPTGAAFTFESAFDRDGIRRANQAYNQIAAASRPNDIGLRYISAKEDAIVVS